MAVGGKDVALGISLLGNVVLFIALAAVVAHVKKGSRGVEPTSKEVDQMDRLVLQLRCGDGDQDACATSLRVDREQCADGIGHACVMLGIAHQVGKRAPKDEAAAVTYFEKGCDLGEGSGCWYAGSCHLQGRGTTKDVARAITLLTKACDKEEKNGCLDLGEAYQKRTPPDVPRALEAYDRGCKLDYDWCCNRARDLRAKSK